MPSITNLACWILVGLLCLLAGLLCVLTAAGVLPLLAGGFGTATTLAAGYAAAHLADRTEA